MIKSFNFQRYLRSGLNLRESVTAKLKNDQLRLCRSHKHIPIAVHHQIKQRSLHIIYKNAFVGDELLYMSDLSQLRIRSQRLSDTWLITFENISTLQVRMNQKNSLNLLLTPCIVTSRDFITLGVC